MGIMSWIAPKTYELVTPDDRVVQYCLYGPESGLPVIAQHGTPGGRWERPDVVAAVEDSGLRMLLVGRPGYGSTRQPGRSIADVAGDVRLLADEVGWAEFAVTGFSGGGPHALACAALLPDRVNYCSTVAGIASTPIAEVRRFTRLDPRRTTRRVLPPRTTWPTCHGDPRQPAGRSSGQRPVRANAGRLPRGSGRVDRRLPGADHAMGLRSADNHRARRYLARLRGRQHHAGAHGVVAGERAGRREPSVRRRARSGRRGSTRGLPSYRRKCC